MKNNMSIKNQKGFTIFEIMIVLAIFGALMVTLFTVMSQTQKSRRDTQRKAYAQSVYQATLEYIKNNKYIPTCIDKINADGVTYTRVCGNASQDAERFIMNYMPTGRDPSTGIRYGGTGTPTDNGQTITSGRIKYHYEAGGPNHEFVPTLGNIEIGVGHWCASSKAQAGQNPSWPIASEDDDTSHPATEQGKYYILIGLEKGFYCLDNYTAG